MARSTCIALPGVTLVATLLVGASAFAQDVDFGRKTITIYIGNTAGGSYDLYGRVVARFLGKHLPGNPSVVVQNVPGAGGLKLANYMAQLAPRDGVEIGITNRNLIAAKMLKMVEAGNVQFESAKFVWLANLTTDVSFFIARAGSGVRTIEDARAREVIVGSTSSADNNGMFPYIANNRRGAKFKVVIGYPSSSALALAMDRGEIDGVVGFSWSSIQVQRPQWLREKDVLLVLQLGLSPLAEAPDVPMILDKAKSETDRKAMELVATLNTLGRPFFGPPQMSAQATAMWRSAFAQLVKNEAFLAQMERQNLVRMEATAEAEAAWMTEVKAIADMTLFPTTDSWYLGANIPGKPRVFMVFLAGGKRYKEICDEVVADNYRGFALSPG
jgi:tripartite-type tricarboxylate transporter receptor subunit TctC